MSRASETAAVGRTLATYPLMGVSQVAVFLDCSHATAMGMVKDKTIPSVVVGKTRKVDPIDLIVHVLAGKEGSTAAAFHEKHGQAVPEMARAYYSQIRKLQAGAA